MQIKKLGKLLLVSYLKILNQIVLFSKNYKFKPQIILWLEK